MQSLIALSLILLTATFANAASSSNPSTPITYMEISFGCNRDGQPDLTSWELNTYAAKSFALRFSSNYDNSILIHDNLITLYGPQNSHGDYAYIVDLGHVMGPVTCQWTGNHEILESSWYVVMPEAGLSFSETQGAPYECDTTERNDRGRDIFEPAYASMTVNDLTGATYTVQPRQCQE